MICPEEEDTAVPPPIWSSDCENVKVADRIFPIRQLISFPSLTYLKDGNDNRQFDILHVMTRSQSKSINVNIKASARSSPCTLPSLSLSLSLAVKVVLSLPPSQFKASVLDDV